MFTKLLRVTLYAILFACAIWGSIVVGGPSALKLIVNKVFGDSLTLYNIRISPKLDIQVSRIKINDVQFNDTLINGSIRSLELGVTGLVAFNPRVEISIGPSQIDKVGNISRAEASLYLQDKSLTSDAIVELELIELASINFFKSERVAIRGALDFRNGVLADTNFKVRNIEGLKDTDFNSPIFQGSISNWHFLDDKMAFPENIRVEIPKLTFLNETILLKDAIIRGGLSDKLYNVELSLKELDGDRGDYKVAGVLADFSIAGFNFHNIEEANVNISSVNLPTFSFLEKGNLTGLSISLSKNNDSSFTMRSNGKLKDGDLKVDDFHIASLSNSDFKLSSQYLYKNYGPSEVKADFNIITGDQTPARLRAAAKMHLSKNGLFRCHKIECLISNFLLNYELNMSQDNMSGFLTCRKFPCQDAEVEHIIKTTNTSAFFDSAQDTGIFNPIFLVFLYQSLLEGQKIGEGHSLQF